MIELCHGALRALVLPKGATLVGLWHARHDHSLVLGYESAKDYDNDPFYLGTIVGPLANRVANGQVEVAGEPWQMPTNEGANCLHGGPTGLSTLEWHVVEHSSNEVHLRVELTHGQGGLPGQRDINVRYRLEDNALHLEITAESDQDTLFNPAHHPYWRLDASPGVPEHFLQVSAEHVLAVSDTLLPTGEVKAVAQGTYDFRNARRVPTDQALDANLCLSERREVLPRTVATLRAANGPMLEIATTEPGLQIYNSSGLFDRGTSVEGKGKLFPFAGLALEPQGWPDAPNQPGFPSVSLAAGEIYNQHTIYHVMT